MKHLKKAMAIAAARYARQPECDWTKLGSEPNQSGIRAWLLDGSGYSNASRRSNGEIEIQCIGDSWARANGSDLIANRQAAHESIFPRNHPEYGDKSLAWPIIGLYYAAYFSAQSLMRCLGVGTVYLEANELNSLNAAWSAKGFNVLLNGSTFLFRLEVAASVTLVLRKLSVSGGAHKQFWFGFQRAQADLRAVILVEPTLQVLSPSQRQQSWIEFETLMNDSFLDSRNVPASRDFAWPSLFRNDTNYRFANRLWKMNWEHSSKLISNLESVVERYLDVEKSLPVASRDFSQVHLAYVACRFLKLVRGATDTFVIPGPT